MSASTLTRYLVVYHSGGGIAELYNVGVFDVVSKDAAILAAKQQWNTTANLFAVSFDDLHDGWSAFI